MLKKSNNKNNNDFSEEENESSDFLERNFGVTGEDALVNETSEIHNVAASISSLDDMDFNNRKSALSKVYSWVEELKSVGGDDSLLFCDDTPRTRLDLSTTHPGGLPQFITGNRILLSNLIRDDLALRNARISAGELVDKATELRMLRGIEVVYLGIGISKWSFDNKEYCAPVLLRPLAIRRFGDDFELKLKGEVFFNPALQRALKEQAGININGDSFVELSLESGVFKPQPVIDHLRDITKEFANFLVQPRLLASTFYDLSYPMFQCSQSIDSSLALAIAGDKLEISKFKNKFNSSKKLAHEIDAESLLLDTDEEQNEILANAASGNSLIVRTIPGGGNTQIIINMAGMFLAKGKSVLVVSPRKATLDVISAKMNSLSLQGLGVTSRFVKRNLVESISRNENIKQVNNSDIDDALYRLKKIINNYRDALNIVDPQLNVSTKNLLQTLISLSRSPKSPKTQIRFDRESLIKLSANRKDVANDLIRLAKLGQFEYGPEESPWYGVKFTTSESAKRAHSLSYELSKNELPALLPKVQEVVLQTNLKPYNSISDVGIYLKLLSGVQETLDKFTPQVYDRSLIEVIAAYSAKDGSDSISGSQRRRMKKLAKEYLRPGVIVSDMLERLRHVEQQRNLWNKYTTVPGSRPEVPLGILETFSFFQSVFVNLSELDNALDLQGTEKSLLNISLDSLIVLLKDLSSESEFLKNVQERSEVIDKLSIYKFDNFIQDLSLRHVPEDCVAEELELAWAQSALEDIMTNNKSLLGANIDVIERLQNDFCLVDEAKSKTTGVVLAKALADNWKIALKNNVIESEKLKQLLKSDSLTIKQIYTHAPKLIDSLAPLWLLSPYEIPLLSHNKKFDLVIIADAGATKFSETLGAISKSDQIVAFGDSVTQSPTDFTVKITPNINDYEEEQLENQSSSSLSTLDLFDSVLPSYYLTKSYRPSGTDLVNIINSRFYNEQIKFLPWAGSYLGRKSLIFDYVPQGSALPDQKTGAVESTDAEVNRVVDLVAEHALNRANESLMVITASPKHAVRLQREVLAMFSRRTDIKDFILKENIEPFGVFTLDQASAISRDRVIFSFAYGRTPHGRVLSNFGALGRPGGDLLLAVAMTRARRNLTLVSCFRPEDVEPVRRKHGVATLMEILESQTLKNDSNLEAEVKTNISSVDKKIKTDPIVQDLIARFVAEGYKVTPDYMGVIPLAIASRVKAVAVDIDFIDSNSSLREALRLRPSLLRRLGWHYIRVSSFEVFSNPDAVVNKILALFGDTDEQKEKS